MTELCGLFWTLAHGGLDNAKNPTHLTGTIYTIRNNKRNILSIIIYCFVFFEEQFFFMEYFHRSTLVSF